MDLAETYAVAAGDPSTPFREFTDEQRLARDPLATAARGLGYAGSAPRAQPAGGPPRVSYW